MSRKKFRNKIARMLRQGGVPFGLAAKLARWIASPLATTAEVTPKLLRHVNGIDLERVTAAVEAAGGKLATSYRPCCSEPGHGDVLGSVEITFGSRTIAG